MQLRSRFARHHADEQAIQRCMRNAMYQANVNKQASPHTLRHSFATHLLYVPPLSGTDIERIELELQRIIG